MLTHDELEEYVLELSEYVEYEGTEVGEYWATLVDLEREMDYMSTPFKEAYQQEVIETLKFIKENYRWEETVFQPPVIEPYTRKTLEWIGDE